MCLLDHVNDLFFYLSDFFMNFKTYALFIDPLVFKIHVLLFRVSYGNKKL